MEQKKQKKLILIISCVLVLLIAASATAYLIWKDSLTPNKPSDPPTSSAVSDEKIGKDVTVKVIANGQTTEFKLETQADFLRGALEEKNLIKGDESEYGLFVTEVNGIKVDPALNQWWRFSKAGEDLMTGVDTTPVADGDSFEITLDTY